MASGARADWVTPNMQHRLEAMLLCEQLLIRAISSTELGSSDLREHNVPFGQIPIRRGRPIIRPPANYPVFRLGPAVKAQATPAPRPSGRWTLPMAGHRSLLADSKRLQRDTSHRGAGASALRSTAFS